MSAMKNMLSIAAVATALASASASDAGGFIVYKVGAAADCPYRTIQEAIDAAAAHPGEDLVWIAHDQAYTNQEVFIADQDVDITGGFDDCDDIDPGTDSTTIMGNGSGGAAVFTIRGASKVFFGNLAILGAHRDGDASGGGIDYDGEGQVQTQYLAVSQNSAGYGGGINMKGEGAGATLELLHDTLFIGNTASTSGGGIRLEGEARLIAVAPSTFIAINHAPNGYGGGIEVLGPAQADIGSAGDGENGVVQSNDAQYGGGIAALAINDLEDPLVRLFTVDPAHPVQIANNSASATGGGIYLKPRFGPFPDTYITNAILCAYDFRMRDNVAQEGSAIYADEDSDVGGGASGSSVALNTNPTFTFRGTDTQPCVTPVPPPALGAVACADGAPCNEIDDNIAEDLGGNPTPGAAILVQTNGQLIADRFSLRGNEGAHAIRLVEFYQADLGDCLLAQNATNELVEANDGYQLKMDSCTIAGNAIAAPSAIHVAAQFLEVTHGIIDQPDVQAIDFAGEPDNLTLQYVLANDTSGMSGLDLISGRPTFVDAAGGDFHLQPDSLGVDYAPAAGGNDLDRHPHDVDLPDEPNAFGPRDLGAYEIQGGTVVDDTIFRNGFD
ncbi:MAG TPA: hypothetical protein VKB52_16875 [Rhodanobacteraceae bacterium]|nr:hypothetical protein [Rhodanobacteraceae bacterium]